MLGASASRWLWEASRPLSRRRGRMHVPSPRRGAPAAPPGASAEAATIHAAEKPRCETRGQPGGARRRVVPSAALALMFAVALLGIQPALAVPDHATSQHPVPTLLPPWTARLQRPKGPRGSCRRRTQRALPRPHQRQLRPTPPDFLAPPTRRPARPGTGVWRLRRAPASPAGDGRAGTARRRRGRSRQPHTTPRWAVRWGPRYHTATPRALPSAPPGVAQGHERQRPPAPRTAGTWPPPRHAPARARLRPLKPLPPARRPLRPHQTHNPHAPQRAP
jgi:hypothetical protein